MAEWLWRTPKRNDTVIYNPPKDGYDFDRWSANQLLIKGRRYTVGGVIEERGKVYLTLREVGGQSRFNMVLFDFVDVPEPE